MSASPSGAARKTPVSVGDMLRRLDWRVELLGLLIVLSEAALVYLVTGVLLAASLPGSPVLPFWIVALLLLAAHLVPHLLDEWRVWSPEYEAITALAIGLTTLVAIKGGSFAHLSTFSSGWLRETAQAFAFLPNDGVRPVWGIVALAAYAWWRGRTREEPSIDSAYTMLRTGSIALAIIIVLVLLIATEGDQARQRLSVTTIAFFVMALASIGVARLKLEGFRTSSPLGPRWIATFVAPIMAVVVVAIVGAGIFSRQFLDTVLWMLGPLFWFLGLVFDVFVLILAIIALLVLTPIIWLIGDRQPRFSIATPVPGSDGERSALERVAESPFQAPEPLRYLIAALILFAIVSLLTRFIFRRRRRQRDATDEVRESVLDWGDLFGSLAARLRGLMPRARVTVDPFAHLRGDDRWRHTLAIRETYLRLQERGELAGRPRHIPETADEYRPGLSSRLATPEDVPAAIEVITEQYRHARYSGVPATAEDADEVRRAWRLVEQAPAP
ncbi:MAG TPA: DUF4129 domain-containing protein [Thermomicrobiales bacterium]|nr:DUF4129 domain-containing protein [Thermomicrobiales bacterium]